MPCDRIRDCLDDEAVKARAFGAVHVAQVFEACARTLFLAPRLRAAIENWPADLASSGVAFRLNAGLNALARSGQAPHLRGMAECNGKGFAPAHYDVAVAEVLVESEAELLHWLSHPTQTNEVARIAGLMGVLCELDARGPLLTELIELGSSAGLNLNLAHYRFDIGGAHLGDRASAVRIAPQWHGQPLPCATVAITQARGVDLFPLDVARSDHREWLFAYTWPGMPERLERLSGALEIAQEYRPQVDCGSAGPWLAQRLDAPQPSGVRRVVFHSMVMQYVPGPEREAIRQALESAGERATPDCPLVRVGLEWREDRRAVELLLTQWDGTSRSGGTTLVATCHPYAEWFDWRGIS